MYNNPIRRVMQSEYGLLVLVALYCGLGPMHEWVASPVSAVGSIGDDFVHSISKGHFLSNYCLCVLERYQGKANITNRSVAIASARTTLTPMNIIWSKLLLFFLLQITKNLQEQQLYHVLAAMPCGLQARAR